MTYKLHFLVRVPIELRRYRTAGGEVPFSNWLSNLDKGTVLRIQAYVDRMQESNFGNSRSVGEGVLELKIDFGSGYRVYYLRDGPSVALLLCGGNKDSQTADIRRAREYARDYWSRK